MPDWINEVPGAIERLRRGEISPLEAIAVADGAEVYRQTLIDRKREKKTAGYDDEIHDLGYTVGELRELARRYLNVVGDDKKIVCIFRREPRYMSPKKGQSSWDHPRHRLPQLVVKRAGQVPFIELDGRQRVRDWYVLLVDGVQHAEGPKRWIMKNAQGAAMMDGNGRLPPWILLTGLARRRQRHKMARDRRRLDRARQDAREKNARERRCGSNQRYYVGADCRVTFAHELLPIATAPAHRRG